MQPTEPATDAFAQAPESGTQPAASYNPVIFGDQAGLGALGGGFQGYSVTSVPTTTGYGLGGAPSSAVSSPVSPSSVTAVRGNVLAALAPSPFHTAIKITENESPLPQTRFFFHYNFFSNVDKSFLPPGIAPSDLHRELVGGEYAFLNNTASIGLRLPIFQLTGNSDFEDSHVGDLSIIFKYALYYNRSTGNVLSTGMVLSTPTGQGVQVPGASTINPVIFQPFVGYICNAGPAFVQGFTSLVVPTDSRDITILYNDIAVGFWLYRNDDRCAFLTGIIPDVELHVNTPLNHRGITDTPLGFTDTVDFTGGAYFNFGRATLGTAVGFPLTGPKPFDIEAIANLNIRF
jgi:hypothetical protein